METPPNDTVQYVRKLATLLANAYKTHSNAAAVSKFVKVQSCLVQMNSVTLQQQIADQIFESTRQYVDKDCVVTLPPADTFEWTSQVFILQDLGLHSFAPEMSEKNRNITHQLLQHIVASAYEDASPECFDALTKTETTPPLPPPPPKELQQGELDMEDLAGDSLNIQSNNVFTNMFQQFAPQQTPQQPTTDGSTPHGNAPPPRVQASGGIPFESILQPDTLKRLGTELQNPEVTKGIEQLTKQIQPLMRQLGRQFGPLLSQFTGNAGNVDQSKAAGPGGRRRQPQH